MEPVTKIISTTSRGPSAAAGLVAVGTSMLEQPILSALDPAAMHAIVPGIVLGLAGGVCAAMMPWGERSWGWREAGRTILLGVIVGTVSALVLMDAPAWIGPGARLGLEAVAGFLAYEILRSLRDLGPRGIVGWLLRRGTPAAPTLPPEVP